jgi:streptogramin lyase
MRALIRSLIWASACLAIGAALWPGGAFARGVHRIKEFGIGEAVHDLTAGPDGNMWFTAAPAGHLFGPGLVGRITPRGKVVKFRTGLSRHSNPGKIIAGPDGNLWFADDGSPPAIGRITPRGAITEFNAGLNASVVPWELVVGPDRNIWFTHTGGLVYATGGQTIGRITPEGAISEFGAGLNPNSSPYEIVAGPDGNLWFSDGSPAIPSRAIGRITPAGEIVEFGGLPSGLQQIFYGPTPGPDGNLWFGGSGPPRYIGRITPAGGVTVFPTGPGRRGFYAGPFVAGRDGNVWFGVDRGAAAVTVGRITPQGAITVFDQCVSAFKSPDSLAVGPDGNVWFGGGSEGAVPRVGHRSAIGRITPDGRITKFSAGLRPDSDTDSIVPGPDRAFWFIDREYEAIGRIGTRATPANGFVPLAAERASRNGAASLPVSVPSPGALKLEPLAIVGRRRQIALKRPRTSTAKSTGCGRVMLRIRPNATAGARLRRVGAVRLRARIRFKPTGGIPRRRTLTIVLRGRRNG